MSSHSNNIKEKMGEAIDSAIEKLNKMSDEELLSNLENCGDSSIAYAIFPELGDDSSINKNDK